MRVLPGRGPVLRMTDAGSQLGPKAVSGDIRRGWIGLFENAQRVLHSAVMVAAVGAGGDVSTDGFLVGSVIKIVANPQGDIVLCLFAVHGVIKNGRSPVSNGSGEKCGRGVMSRLGSHRFS